MATKAAASPTTDAASTRSSKKHRNPFSSLFGKSSRKKDDKKRPSLAVKAYNASHTGGEVVPPTASTSKTTTSSTRSANVKRSLQNAASKKTTKTASTSTNKTTTSDKKEPNIQNGGGGNFLTRTKFFQSMLENAFHMVDADGSGEVDEQELYSGLLLIHLKLGTSLGPAACKPISREQCKTMFEKVDVDHSGTLDRSEFDAVMMVLFGNALLRVAFQYSCTIILVPLLAQQILTAVQMSISTIYHYVSTLIEDNTQVDEFGSLVWDKIVATTPTALDNFMESAYNLLQKVPPSVWNALPLTLTSTLLSMMLIPWSLMRIDDYFQSLAEKKKLKKEKQQ